MRVLGIETSCDETGLAIVDDKQGLLAHVLHSQTDLHAAYGGVVPELASRDHLHKLPLLLEQLLNETGQVLSDLDAIAYTAGPGLVGALLTGVGMAQGVAWSLGLPALEVHHLEGHLLVPMLENPDLEWPFLALLVSGGHTMLVDVQAMGEYRILGSTLDDAAGEAFDKTAKMMGLPYPGGPELARLAEQGNETAFAFTRPMVDRPGLDFSFSGLKTQVWTCFRQQVPEQALMKDMAASFQKTVVDTLRIKCRRAMQESGHKRLVIAGGVGANRKLRTGLSEDAEKHGWQVFFPSQVFCTDNGAMIAYAGLLRLMAGQSAAQEVRALPRWSLESIQPL